MSYDVKYDIYRKLRLAVEHQEADEVERLLQHPNLDVKPLEYGILTLSVVTGNMRIFLSLLNAGFDVNGRGYDSDTALHEAASAYNFDTNLSLAFLCELIKRGADVNALNCWKWTPLHCAADCRQLEPLCALLYYGADANISSEDNTIPFMVAVQYGEVQACKILLTFYNDLSQKPVKGNTTLYLAAMDGTPFAIDILKVSNIIQEELRDILGASVSNYDNADLFKLILNKCTQCFFPDEICFTQFIITCEFSNCELLECLHLLFNSPITTNHVMKYRCNHIFELNKENVMHKLLVHMHYRRLERRLDLMYLCLSFGAGMNSIALNLVYLLYGFNEELEALLFGSFYQKRVLSYKLLPLPRRIFFLEKYIFFDDITPIFDFLFGTDIAWRVGRTDKKRIIMNSLGFSSLSFSKKKSIRHLCGKHFTAYDRDAIFQRLHEIPEIPALVELSRDSAWQFIKQKCKSKAVFQFYDTIRNLHLPQYLKDILSYKIPLY